MKKETFKKVVGRAKTITTENQSDFHPTVLTLLTATEAEKFPAHSALLPNDNENLILHLVYSYNAPFFTTDGSKGAVHLIIHDTKSNTSWIERTAFSKTEKEAKRNIRDIKDLDFSAEKTTEELIAKEIEKRIKKSPESIAYMKKKTPTMYAIPENQTLILETKTAAAEKLQTEKDEAAEAKKKTSEKKETSGKKEKAIANTKKSPEAKAKTKETPKKEKAEAKGKDKKVSSKVSAEQAAKADMENS